MTEEPYIITMMNGDEIKVLFGEATVEQQTNCYALAAGAWGSYLDEDEVIAREKHLAEQTLARNGGCQTWCLYRQDDHSQILSTCKTIRRDFIVSGSGGNRDIRGCCVSSVYTPLLYRGHGLASQMLRNVAQWLDGPGKAAVSLLYSGIPEWYEKVGWTKLPNTENILSSAPWLQETLGPYADLEVRPLSDADIQELCAEDVQGLRAETHYTNFATEESKLTVLPTADLVRYQHALSDYMGDLWCGAAPEKRGAAYKDQAWLYWQHDYRSRRLYIQRVHNAIQGEEEEPGIMAALLLAAFREANEWNFTAVVTWDTSTGIRRALDILAQSSIFKMTVNQIYRTQRISLRWRYGEKTAGNVVTANETYAWNSRG